MPLRWAAWHASGGRSPDCLLRPRSPGCLSDCGSYAFGGGCQHASLETALSCTGAARLPAVVLLVKNLRRRRRSVRVPTQSLARCYETASRWDERRLATIERFPRARAATSSTTE